MAVSRPITTRIEIFLRSSDVIAPNSDLEKEVQEKLDRLKITLTANGLKIFDPYLNGIKVKSVQFEDFVFKPAAKTTILDMSYDGLTIPLSSLVDRKGLSFEVRAVPSS